MVSLRGARWFDPPSKAAACFALFAFTTLVGSNSAPAQTLATSSIVWKCSGTAAELPPSSLEQRKVRFVPQAAESFRTGRHRLAASDFEQALAHFDRAIELDPDNPHYYLARATTFAYMENLNRARDDIERSIKLDPGSPVSASERMQVHLSAAHLGLAHSHMTKESFDHAIREADQAIAYYASNSAAHLVRGAALSRQGEHQRAIETFNEAIRLDPGCNPAYAYLSTSNRRLSDFRWAISELRARATSNYLKGAYDAALRDLDDVLARNPGIFEAVNNRCVVRGSVGLLDEALSDCQEALRLWPGNKYSLASRASVYFKKGALDDAAADFEAALRIDPKFANALYARGLLRKQRGDTAGGDEDIAAAIALRPDVETLIALYRFDK
jgi:tetratricopeptide (TPR) repeat protein